MFQLSWILVLGVTFAGPAPRLQSGASAAAILAMARDGRGTDAIAAYRRLPDGPEKSTVGVDLGALTGQFDLSLDAYRAQRQRLGADDPALLRRFATNMAQPATTAPEALDWTRACAAVAALKADDRAGICQQRLAQTAADAAIGWEARGLAIFSAIDQRVPAPPAARVAFDADAPARYHLEMAALFRHLPPDERAALATPVAAGADLQQSMSAGLLLGESCTSQAMTALHGLAGHARSELKNIGLLGLAMCGEAASLERLRPLAARLTSGDQLRITAGLARRGEADAIARLEAMAAGGPSDDRSLAFLILAQAAPARAVDLARRLFAAPVANWRALLDDTMDVAPILGPQPGAIDALAAGDLPTRTMAAAWLARALSR